MTNKAIVLWAAEVLGITDWEFSVETSVRPPKWSNDEPEAFGRADMDSSKKEAKIWVRKGEPDEDETLLHEILHVALCDAGLHTESGPGEHLINRLAAIMLKAMPKTPAKVKKCR